jgi:hypothetical protein
MILDLTVCRGGCGRIVIALGPPNVGRRLRDPLARGVPKHDPVTAWTDSFTVRPQHFARSMSLVAPAWPPV